MTKTVTNDTAREHCRPAMLAAAATATMMILTGCSSSSSTAPTSAPATTPATSTNPAASLDAEKTKVIAAYDAYLQATVRLYAGGKADPKILEGTATPESARHDAQQAAVMFSTGGRMVGTITSTPRSVQITGNTAILVTCNDDSKWFAVKAGTTPTPSQTGGTPGLAQVQLRRNAQGKWLVADSKAAGQC